MRSGASRGTGRAVRDLELPHLSVHRRLQLERGHLSRQIVDDRLLTRDQRLPTLHIETDCEGCAANTRSACSSRKRAFSSASSERSSCNSEYAPRSRARRLRSSSPLGGAEIGGRLGLLLTRLGRVAFGIELRALQLEALPSQARAPRASFATRSGLSSDGEYLAGFHRIARPHAQRDLARGGGIQHRAARGDHATIRRVIAHEASALDGADRHSGRGHRGAHARGSHRPGNEHDQQRDDRHAARDGPAPAPTASAARSRNPKVRGIAGIVKFPP